MKKSLLSLAGLALVSTAFMWSVNAQLDISELFSNGAPLQDNAYSRVLNEYDSSRWYSDAISVACDSNSSSVKITSPLVQDSDYYDVTSYRLFLSPYRIDQLKWGDTAVNNSQVIIKEAVKAEGSNEITFNVNESDGLSPNQVYYGFVLPINDFDLVWTPTKEICFQMTNNVCLQDSACDSMVATNDEVIERHWTSCVWMDLANVTHVQNWDKITLKWTAVEGDVVQIAIFDKDEKMYKSLWTVKMSDEKFDYTIEKDWEQNFSLTNGCGEYRYKADAKKWEKEPEKIVTPATGPAENILYIAIAAIVLYGAYVLFFRKAENK